MAETLTTNAGLKKYDAGDNAADGIDWNEGYNDNWDLLDAMNGVGLDWDASTPKKLAVQVDDSTIEISGDDLRVKDAFPINRVHFTPLAAEPGTPADGDVCYANGSGWNPGSGAGLYVRSGGTWAKLH